MVTEGVVSHGPDGAVFVEGYEVVVSCADLHDVFELLDVGRLVADRYVLDLFGLVLNVDVDFVLIDAPVILQNPREALREGQELVVLAPVEQDEVGPDVVVLRERGVEDVLSPNIHLTI
jgi:hypothetical protein